MTRQEDGWNELKKAQPAEGFERRVFDRIAAPVRGRRYGWLAAGGLATAAAALLLFVVSPNQKSAPPPVEIPPVPSVTDVSTADAEIDWENEVVQMLSDDETSYDDVLDEVLTENLEENGVGWNLSDRQITA